MTIQIYSGSEKPANIRLNYEIYENEKKERIKPSKNNKNIKVFVHVKSDNLHISQQHYLFSIIRQYKVKHLKSMDKDKRWSAFAKMVGLKVIE